MNSDVAKWARSQSWTVEDDAKGYTRFFNPDGECIMNYPATPKSPQPAHGEPDGGTQEGALALAAAKQERKAIPAQERRRRMSDIEDWVITLTFAADPAIEQMDFWENELEELDASVARIPGRGVDVTVYVTGDIPMFEAAEKMASAVGHVVHAPLAAVEVVDESEWQRRADSPTMPELMSAAEIAEELGISRQRVHQLRSMSSFPAPLADLRGGAVWDAVAIRKFGEYWERRPGRPRSVVISPRSGELAVRGGVSGVLRSTKTGMAVAMSGKANSREVVPNADGGWDVKKPGASR